MSRYGLIARTVPMLGWRNVARVAFYQAKLKTGWRPTPPEAPCPEGPVYGLDDRAENGGSVTLKLFGWYPVDLATVPDWHADPFDPTNRQDTDVDWVAALRRIGDGDVKRYWELSRFYWLPQFALAARDGDVDAASRIETWLRDWITANPPYRGINWACGQEASIRLMNLALAALLLDTWRDPSPAMKWLIETHARRIRPTLAYALGQDNNHGTAETCALLVAGSWGMRWSMPRAKDCEQIGLRWLNDRALRMIQPDGSPCQYSTTYHRTNLEGFCMAGLWSERTGAPGLSDRARNRISEGARWLHAITDPDSGDAPNLGSNDSSHLFAVPPTAYRDFRPTVALAAALFDDGRPWPYYDDPRLSALGLPQGDHIWPAATSRSSDIGGIHVLRRDNVLAMMHYPSFRFRPCQSDLLHLDLWADGQNLLRDDGSYSYRPDEAGSFGTPAAHNTIEFDGRDQLPRLGRFLYGDWPEATRVRTVEDHEDGVSAGAGYRDAHGNDHDRQVRLHARRLTVVDRIAGPFATAVLRWRLKPGDYRLEGDTVIGPDLRLSVCSKDTRIDTQLTTGWESQFYLHRSEIPVLEVTLKAPATVETEITF